MIIKKNHISNFTKYLSVGIFVTLLNIFFSWLFIDIIGMRAILSSTIVGLSIFFVKYFSYTRVNLIRRKTFHIFLLINLTSVMSYIIFTALLIDVYGITTLIAVPLVVIILFILRFFAFYWTRILNTPKKNLILNEK
jgi:putative flippase GtrA